MKLVSGTGQDGTGRMDDAAVRTDRRECQNSYVDSVHTLCNMKNKQGSTNTLLISLFLARIVKALEIFFFHNLFSKSLYFSRFLEF